VDGLFGVGGRWRLWSCGGCSAGFLNPRPSVRSIGRAYSTYYTHATGTSPSGGNYTAEPKHVGIRQQVKNAYLNRYWGYRLAPAFPLSAPITRWAPLAHRHADRWVRHLPRPASGSRLLDVGCGDGAFIDYMADLGWHAQGIDTDPAAIEAAKARGCKADLRQLSELLPAADEDRFDVITLCHVLEHFHHPQQELELCRQLLRPQGRIWIATPNLAGMGHRIYGARWRGLEPPRHLCIYTPSSLFRQLASAGYSDVTLLATQPTAKRMFSESAELEHRLTGRNRLRDSSLAIAGLSTIVNLLAGPFPGVGDELVATAHNS
jgi:2-polyprenyl-3-methyl-5-hydroxy-6-metoxy-1,4-benzoquinol methylase